MRMIKFSNIINMYVNKPGLANNHLLTWATLEAARLGFKKIFVAPKSVIQSGAFALILKSVDPQYFGLINEQQDNLEQLLRVIETFLMKEFGKRLKVSVRGQMVQENTGEMIKLLLFCCLHSKQKQEYISRIFELDQQIQSTLMDAIQFIACNLHNVANQNDVLLRVQQLENQNQQIRMELAMSQSRQASSRKVMEQLQEELRKKNNQIRIYKAQKQKVMDALKLSTFQQYLTLFQRMQQENSILTRYVEELEDANAEHEQKSKHLHRDLENQSVVIVDLNDNITSLKEKINTMKMEASLPTFSNKNVFEETFDVTRSFGTELKNYNNRECGLSARRSNKNLRSFEDWDESHSQVHKQNETQMALMDQMKQLRKYNSDLMQKLDTVYKTVNNLTLQSSHIKEKNESLSKENKFYRKQIGSLRKLQERMEADILAGLI